MSDLLAQYRVVGDDSLTGDAEVYEVTETDDLNPQWPVRYRLDVTGGTPILSEDQPGDWAVPDQRQEMFIDLATVVKLGQIAQALIDRASQDVQP